jgi:hypothetical protein
LPALQIAEELIAQRGTVRSTWSRWVRIFIIYKINYLSSSFSDFNFLSAPSCLGLPTFQVLEELIAQRGTVWLAWSRWVRILIIYKMNYLSSCWFDFSFLSAPSRPGLPDFQVVEKLIAQRGTVWLAWSRWVRILIIYKINYLSSCFSDFHFLSAPLCLGLPDFQVVEELIAQRGTVRFTWSRWVQMFINYKINYLFSCFSMNFIIIICFLIVISIFIIKSSFFIYIFLMKIRKIIYFEYHFVL